jgi:hypothetical protein
MPASHKTAQRPRGYRILPIVARAEPSWLLAKDASRKRLPAPENSGSRFSSKRRSIVAAAILSTVDKTAPLAFFALLSTLAKFFQRI